MATAEQIQQMLDMMAQQMTQLTALHQENAARAANPLTEAVTAAVTYPRSRRPDRPTIEANMDDREWALFSTHGTCTRQWQASFQLMI